MGGSTGIIGGGIAGLTAAWQLQKLGQDFTLYEATGRLGGPIETHRRDGFTIELGPDGWVTEKPWAAELAQELGLGAELIASNDATRVTWIVQNGALVAMPDGMRMMVPGDSASLEGSPLFSAEAIAAYDSEPFRAEALRTASPAQDESIAEFVERHFGAEVLRKVGAPLLSGVFGGDVAQLSVRAVMPQFVAMEREHGSLIVAVERAARARAGRPVQPVFTTLSSGVGLLIERIAAEVDSARLTLNTKVTAIERESSGWAVHTARGRAVHKRLIVATPAHATCELLRPVLSRIESLLPARASSAVLVAFAFDEEFALPKGFGFLAPAGEAEIMAATFTDQKFTGRVPAGKRLLRAFFGGPAESAHDVRTDEELAHVALAELRRILAASGAYSLPEPVFTLVRRWPRSLPQYAVNHLERMAELDRMVTSVPGLTLLGNAYRGVGLPDLIREARAAARAITVASA